MKTKVAMMISVAGVLVAGSAAALVNTQVLDSKAATPTSLSIDNGQQTAQTAPTVTSPSIVQTPTATQPAVVATPSLGATTSATQVVYAIGSAGTVTLDTAGDVLTIVGITPAAGWVVTESESDDSNSVEIKLRAGGDLEAEFHANLLFGVVTVSTESNDDFSDDNSADDHGDDGSNSGHGGDDSGSDD